jgi:hypothetical protein
MPAPGPAPVAPPGAKVAHVYRAPKRVKEVVPAGPLPDVQMALEAPTRLGPWSVRVTNHGDVPVRLVADARLLVLEATPRSASKAVRCELPADMRPGDDMEGALVLPPGRSYVETFEPRLYCFGARSLEALSAGATVVGRLGWSGARAHGPYVVQSIDGVEPLLAPLKSIDSPPVALPDDPTPAFIEASAANPSDPDPAHLVVRGQPAIDAPSASNIAVAVTLRNQGKRPVAVRFRPDTLGFEVAGPTGVQDCHWPVSPSAAMRELFTTLRPAGAADLSVLLADYCDSRSFSQPGLVVITPRMDTRKASGADVALRTFDGVVTATAPTIVRLHQGLKPPHLRHPRLEPLPGSLDVPAPAPAPSPAPAPTPTPAPARARP